MMELFVVPSTPTEPKRYLREPSRRSVESEVRWETSKREEIQGERTEETTDLVGGHEGLSELLGVLEGDLPDGIAFRVVPTMK